MFWNFFLPCLGIACGLLAFGLVLLVLAALAALLFGGKPKA